MNVTLNVEQRLYVIPCDHGFSCVGFDVAYEWAKDIAHWLQVDISPNPDNIGTIEGYNEYKALAEKGNDKFIKTGKRCESHLVPELRGLEGKRVEVKDKHGGVRRFIVGKSIGWFPIHLEIKNKRSSGGIGVYGLPFQYVRVIKG